MAENAPGNKRRGRPPAPAIDASAASTEREQRRLLRLMRTRRTAAQWREKQRHRVLEMEQEREDLRSKLADAYALIRKLHREQLQLHSMIQELRGKNGGLQAQGSFRSCTDAITEDLDFRRTHSVNSTQMLVTASNPGFEGGVADGLMSLTPVNAISATLQQRSSTIAGEGLCKHEEVGPGNEMDASMGLAPLPTQESRTLQPELLGETMEAGSGNGMGPMVCLPLMQVQQSGSIQPAPLGTFVTSQGPSAANGMLTLDYVSHCDELGDPALDWFDVHDDSQEYDATPEAIQSDASVLQLTMLNQGMAQSHPNSLMATLTPDNSSSMCPSVCIATAFNMITNLEDDIVQGHHHSHIHAASAGDMVQATSVPLATLPKYTSCCPHECGDAASADVPRTRCELAVKQIHARQPSQPAQKAAEIPHMPPNASPLALTSTPHSPQPPMRREAMVWATDDIAAAIVDGVKSWAAMK